MRTIGLFYGSTTGNTKDAAEQIKAFAQTGLGLPVEDSYSSYAEVEGEALVWNVIATREFSLQPKKWCFPVAGCVPYRGYFKQQKAQDFAERLSRKGMDVIVSPAAAYSSLSAVALHMDAYPP